MRKPDWVSLVVPVDSLLAMWGRPIAAELRDLHIAGMASMLRHQAALGIDEVEQDGDTFWFPTPIKRYEFQRAIEWYKRCLTPEAPAHFNKLTPAEDERLAKLSEECAEVIQAICKIQRHGYNSCNPDAKGALEESNREYLERELADVMFAIARMMHTGDVNMDRMEQLAAVDVAEHYGRYMHHQEPLDGTAAK